MKAKLSRRAQWLISAIISLLGFSGCAATSKAADSDVAIPEEDSIEMPQREIRVMYGTPTWGYQADGRVTDEKCKPIKGVRIEATLRDRRGTLETQIIYSGKDGKFQTHAYDTPIYEDKKIISLSAIDEDGRKRGGDFSTAKIDLTKMKPVLDKSTQTAWYDGTFKYNNLEITLKRK